MNVNVVLHVAMSAPVNLERQSGGVDQEPEDGGSGLLHSCSSVSSSVKWPKYRCLLSLLTYSAFHKVPSWEAPDEVRSLERHRDQGIYTGQSCGGEV